MSNRNPINEDNMQSSNMRIPAHYGPGANPIKMALLHTIPIVGRECLTNAKTYQADDAHCVRIFFPDIEQSFFTFMHNGIPFGGRNCASLQRLDEIKKLGLTPNESGGVGCAFQGSGLTYCAAYLNYDNPQLTIASRDLDGNLVAATALPEISTNRWNIIDAPDWSDRLSNVLGPKFHNKYTVFYLFRIPNEKSKNYNFNDGDDDDASGIQRFFYDYEDVKVTKINKPIPVYGPMGTTTELPDDFFTAE